MSKKYMSPDGAAIIGTSEVVPAVAGINGINDDGTPDYDGSGSQVHWDGRTTSHPDGKTVLYIDDDGFCWTFDRLLPIPDEDAG